MWDVLGDGKDYLCGRGHFFQIEDVNHWHNKGKVPKCPICEIYFKEEKNMESIKSEEDEKNYDNIANAKDSLYRLHETFRKNLTWLETLKLIGGEMSTAGQDHWAEVIEELIEEIKRDTGELIVEELI